MNAAELRIDVLPNDLLVASYFEHLGHFRLSLAITTDDRITVRQSLTAARIGESTVNVAVVDSPDNFAGFVELDGLVAVRQVDQRVAVLQTNGGEGPVLSRSPAEFSRSGTCP